MATPYNSVLGAFVVLSSTPLLQNWMPGAWIGFNGRRCTCFLLCLSDQSFPSPALVQRQDGLVFKSSSSSFLSQGSSEDDHSFLSASPSPQTAGSGSLDRGWKALVLSLDGPSLLRSHLTETYGFSMADRLVNGKRLLLYTRRILLGKAPRNFYLPWKILES